MQITKPIPIPQRINQGVQSAKQQTMLTLVGNPRSSYGQNCQMVTNPGIKQLIVTKDVGPFKVNGLQPAVESLTQVLADIKTQFPDVYNGLGTAGMLCVRYVRESTTAISNHSWGTAIDLTLNGILDTRNDNKVQSGLAQIAPIFNSHGWFWGAGFRKEDAMHFEVGDQKIREWHASGIFGNNWGRTALSSVLSLGDRGPEVVDLQKKLNAFGESLDMDGEFGRNTLAAVMAFQSNQGLIPDGVVGEKTRQALGL